MNQTLISLSGYQGSGKTTIGKLLAEHLGVSHLETSDIVRGLVGDVDREELPSTAELTKEDPTWLGKNVVACIEQCFEDSEIPIVVLTGVREVEVHDYIEAEGIDLFAFEVTAPMTTRYKRLIDLGKVKNGTDFIQQEIRERSMGLDKVMKEAPFTVPTSEDTNPQSLCKAVVKALKKEGLLI